MKNREKTIEMTTTALLATVLAVLGTFKLPSIVQSDSGHPYNRERDDSHDIPPGGGRDSGSVRHKSYHAGPQRPSGHGGGEAGSGGHIGHGFAGPDSRGGAGDGVHGGSRHRNVSGDEAAGPQGGRRSDAGLKPACTRKGFSSLSGFYLIRNRNGTNPGSTEGTI